MYQLSDSLLTVKGIGPKTARKLKKRNLKSIKDLLLFLPLNYSDLSQISPLKSLQPGQSYTVKAQVVAVSEYFKNKKRLTKATISDRTGRTQCMWFNSRFVKQQLKKGETYYFAGEYSQYHTFTQPKIEAVKAETIHTGRLVPRYSQTLNIKQGNMRRILKEILSNLSITQDKLGSDFQLLTLKNTFTQLHFPEKKELVVKARKRLAIEELLALIKQSFQNKQLWRQKQPAAKLTPEAVAENGGVIPDFLPFTLTNDQTQAVKTIIQDLAQSYPMNRLLIGDVGSGKTVVAGIAAFQLIQAGFSCALIAPTQILAEQHRQTFHSIFSHLKTKLLTGETDKNTEQNRATLYIGTHAVINQLSKIKPALVIFDEQHRFGVAQRAEALQEKTSQFKKQPHILTMSATPIPRSYMLTIFAHLAVSIIKEFPFGEKNIKSFVVPEAKEQKAYQWMLKQLLKKPDDENKANKADGSDQKKQADQNKQADQKNQATEKKQAADSTSPQKILPQNSRPQNPLGIIVCPFINPSDNEAFFNVPAASEIYQKLEKKWGKKLRIALLHGQQKTSRQEKIIERLFAQQIDLLITTSIVELGVDLPQANIMMIQGADRFGLASLHQLRGRVGRHSQESYCLLFNSSDNQKTNDRLHLFAQENNGLVLAELDLKNRGPGDLFGLKQHGLDNLKFADWHNLKLINQAKKIFNQINDEAKKYSLLFEVEKSKLREDAANIVNN